MTNFLQAIDIITDPELGAIAWGEREADRQITLATYQSMIKELSDGREKGKAGWWDASQIDIAELYKMREKAIEQGEHVRVIVTTSMIAAREMECYLYVSQDEIQAEGGDIADSDATV
ncbi:hypothetical protein F7U66_24670 [Vibrio parahaemolyticus]|nr:hypothetical protein [Vibrio parahaemolyticus]